MAGRTRPKDEGAAWPVNTAGRREMAPRSTIQSLKRSRKEVKDEPDRSRKPPGTVPLPSQEEHRYRRVYREEPVRGPLVY